MLVSTEEEYVQVDKWGGIEDMPWKQLRKNEYTLMINFS